jgi:hypothetical protein
LISVSSLSAVVETVKNRVLRFTLEIESTMQAAAEITPGAPRVSVSDERVSQIFNVTIMGNVGNVASGGAHFSQVSSTEVGAGDIGSLREALAAAGVSEATLHQISQDLQSSAPANRSERVKHWIGELATSGGKIMLEAAIKSLTAYLGIPQA